MRRPGLRFMATTTGVVVAATLALAVSLLAGPAPVVAQSASGAAPSGAAALRLDYDHLVLGAAGDRLTVREAVGLNNAGPSGLSRIVLPLPTGYADLKLESGFAGGKAAAETGNLVDTSGLAGGAQREVVFSYSLPLSAAKTAGFAKRLDYVTGALSITAEARSIRLAGSRGLTALTSELNGVAYNRLKAGNVPAGTSFDVEVTVGSFSTASAPPPGAGTAAVGKAGRLLNRSIHGGPDNVMLWQRFTGRPGHWGLPLDNHHPRPHRRRAGRGRQGRHWSAAEPARAGRSDAARLASRPVGGGDCRPRPPVRAGTGGRDRLPRHAVGSEARTDGPGGQGER